MANYALGKILELYGLSKVEMNNKLIAVDGMRTDESGLLRYKCMLLDNPTESFFIKASNLKEIPSPSEEDVEEFNILINEISEISREIRKALATSPSTNLESLHQLGQQKLEKCKKVNPEMGMIYILCADFVRMKDQTNSDSVFRGVARSAPQQAAFLKIAIANLDPSNPSNYQIILMARTSYSGSLGDMGDYLGEYEQLIVVIDEFNREDFDTYRILAADSLLNQNRMDEAFEVINRYICILYI
jgi:hypothetical protein